MDSFDAPGTPPLTPAMDELDGQPAALGDGGWGLGAPAPCCDDLLNDYLSGVSVADIFVFAPVWDAAESGDFSADGDRIDMSAPPVGVPEAGASVDAFLFDWDDPGGAALTGCALDELHRML